MIITSQELLIIEENDTQDGGKHIIPMSQIRGYHKTPNECFIATPAGSIQITEAMFERIYKDLTLKELVAKTVRVTKDGKATLINKKSGGKK